MTTSRTATKSSTIPVFVDVFAGCGGLSLGLMQAGWQGLFAIERDTFAFETLKENLLSSKSRYSFNWPEELPKRAMCVNEALTAYKTTLSALAGKIDLLAGGPPCQGFSTAGRRDPNDPRNAMIAAYLELVSLLQPKMLLLENVKGFTQDFATPSETGTINYSHALSKSLNSEYRVHTRTIKVSEFGVPQARTRFFLIALRKDRVALDFNPFELLENRRSSFLRVRGLNNKVSSSAAISDLEETRNGRVESTECKGFDQLLYVGPRTSFQRHLNAGCEGVLTNTRLAKHHPDIIKRFQTLIHSCKAEGRLNRSIGKELRELHGLKKQALRVLDPDQPAPTITSMPDDLLHYREPRTLTVRENARLQSFPDWFVFKGKYTTGGHLRRVQVPRFTQVANAVPPLVAEALGEMLFLA